MKYGSKVCPELNESLQMKQKTRGQQLGGLTHQCCQNVITVLVYGCAFLLDMHVCVVHLWHTGSPSGPGGPLSPKSPGNPWRQRVAFMLCCTPVINSHIQSNYGIYLLICHIFYISYIITVEMLTKHHLIYTHNLCCSHFMNLKTIFSWTYTELYNQGCRSNCTVITTIWLNFIMRNQIKQDHNGPIIQQ